MLWRAEPHPLRLVTVAGALFVAAPFAVAQALVANEGAPQATPQSAAVQLYESADDGALPVGTVTTGEKTTPIAETQGVGGVRWYLIRTNSGITGWIKQTDNAHSKQAESFFKSRPADHFVTAVAIPNLASAAAPPGTIVVPVLSTGRSTIVTVTFNRSVSGNLMVDTGATNTVVSKRLAALLSLRRLGNTRIQTVGGVIGAAVARLQSLQVGEAEVMDLPVVIHDFSRDPRFEGLLGMDFLARYRFGLDLQKQLLVLAPK